MSTAIYSTVILDSQPHQVFQTQPNYNLLNELYGLKSFGILVYSFIPREPPSAIRNYMSDMICIQWSCSSIHDSVKRRVN